MKLYYAETLNPRKACAVARHLHSPVEFVRVDLARGEHKMPEFLALNPNGKVPVLQNGDECLWEANAIMCHLSDVARSDLWPHDARQVDVLRWLSWDAQHFTPSGGTLYFEYVVKPRIGLGAPDSKKISEALAEFRTYAHVLDAHLQNRSFLVGESLTVADFAVASALPYAEQAELPVAEFAGIRRWYARLEQLPAWREPFPPEQSA
jgi:glutathione S-transferase